jgi:putative serine protease PepD
MKSPRIILVTVLAALVGAGAGAGAYAVLNKDNSTTVVRQVHVTQSVQASNTQPGTQLTVGSIYKLANRGVVKVLVTSGGGSSFGQQGTQQAQGSGFVYDTNGHVITNEHVIDGATSIKAVFWNGKTYPAHLVGSDASTDTAVIRVDAPSSVLHPLAFADSSTVQVGDGVVAIGAPFGLDETVTAGIVSALHREMTSPNNFTIDNSIQTDAAINHGNSGGPLLNMQGRVIGTTAQIESDSGGNDGVGFAVPSNTVKQIAERLIATGKVEHAYLGVQLTSAPNGARVTQVVPGKAAQQGGVKAGDVITSFGGKKVTGIDSLRFAVDAKHPGESVTLTVQRNGQSKVITVTLSTRPNTP